MNLHTDKEYIDTSGHFLLRLKNLFKNKREEFYQIQDFMPFPVYINHRQTFEYEYLSDNLFSRGEEVRNLSIKGLPYLYEISDLHFLEQAIETAKSFDQANDQYAICNYLQIISLNKKMTPYYTNKILIDENSTLNASIFPLEFQGLDKIFKELIPYEQRTSELFVRFQSLTKREKEILKLIIQGHTNRQIGEILYISSNTVRTHRNKIWKKLEIKHLRDVFKFQFFLE